MRAAITIYLAYAAIILAIGYVAYDKLVNSNNPGSLRHSINELNRVLDEGN